MSPNNVSDSDFVQEYLYIEEYDFDMPKSKSEDDLEKEEKEKIERGVLIIDIL